MTTSAPVTLTVRVPVNDFWHRDSDRYEFAGLQVARRFARDRPPFVWPYVRVVSGGWAERGGSVANPKLAPKPGTVLEIELVPEGHPDVTFPGVEVVSRAIDLDGLREERARLRERIARIDSELAAALIPRRNGGNYEHRAGDPGAGGRSDG